MTSLRRLPLCALVTVLLSSTTLIAQQAAPAVRITAPIDASQLVTLKGTVHPLANARNDRGPASPGMQLERLHLIFKRSPAQETALRQLIQEQNTPGSANFHKWLTPAQFAAQFGPSAQDISTVENWLSDQGFTVNRLLPGSQALEVSGNVGQLQSAFHTQIRKYMVNGQLHYANAIDPQIPAALAPVVGGFASLNNFRYRHYAQKLGEANYDPSTGQARGSWTIGGGTFDYQKYQFPLTPADFAIQYDLPATVKGDGQTIAIVNESNINIYLVNQFRSLFGLSANPPQVIIDGNDPGIDGINNPDGPNGASVEAYLDVEWAGAVAPNATVDLVIAGDTSLESGLALAAEHAVYSNVAPVVSISFGNCEANNGSSNAFWNKLWEQAAAQGQTVIVSSGDNGSAGCDFGAEYATNGLAVNGLASTPWNVAVGGTDFYYSSWNSGSASTINTQLGTYWNTTASNSTPTASIKGYIPEQPWNSSQYGLNLFNVYTLSGSSTIAAGSGGASSAALCSTNTYSPTTGACTGTTSGYLKPAWQTGVTGIPSDGVRDVPDVSLFAANGYNDTYYAICATDADCQPASAGSIVQIFGVGGTSAAAPAFAGMMALVNQKYGRQGQANTILYPMKTQFPAAFHEIKNGTNSVPCEFAPSLSTNCIQLSGVTYATVQSTDSLGNTINVNEGQIGTGTTAAYNAIAGYNLATGLGSIDAAQLVNSWGSVTLGASAVTLNAAPTSIVHGQNVFVSGAVTGTGTPTGNVAIMSDSTEPSQQGQTTFPLDSNGRYANGAISTLPGGSYNIWAHYSGDSKNGPSDSAKVPVFVNPEASGIAFGLFENGARQYLTSNQTTSIDYGTQLMLSARVAPSADVTTLQQCTTSSTVKCPTYSAPTGTIAFKDNTSTLNTAVINTEGDAEFNAPFSVGQHSVSASYSGDNSYMASTTSTPPAISFTVVKDTPQLFVAASNQISCGTGSNGFCVLSGTNQPTVLNILVENGAQVIANCGGNTATCSSSAGLFPVPVAAPTGSVTLSGSGLPSGVGSSVQLSPGIDPTDGAQVGIATITIPATTTQSSYNVTLSYSGDGNYNALTGSNAATGTVQIVTSTGVVTQTTASMAGAISPKSTITITGTVTAASGSSAPTGDVYLFSSGNYVTSATLTAGAVTTAKTAPKSSLWPAAGGSVLAAAVFFWIPRRRRSWLAMMVMLAFLISVSGLACGGGGSSSNGGGGGNGGGGSGGGGTASFKFVVNSQTLVQGANYLTVQYAGTNTSPYFLPSAFDLSNGKPTSNLLSDFSLVPATPMVQVAANGSSNDAISVSSMNGFSGSVALTCSAPAAVTCSVTQPASLTAGASATATLTINAPSGTAAGNYPVEITGKDSTGEYIHTLAITAAIR